MPAHILFNCHLSILVVVEAGASVEEVVELALDLVHSATGELSKRQDQGEVRRNGKEGACFVPQVLGVDEEGQLIPEGKQVVESERCAAKQAVLLHVIRVLRGPALEDGGGLVEIIKVRVNDSSFLALIGPVEDLQHVPADELVIAVEIDNDGVLSAMVDRGKVNVLEGKGPPNVFDVSIALLVDGVEAEEAAEDFVAIVGGSVVDDDHLVVGVVLCEEGVEVGLDAEPCIVVVARHHDAHRQLLLQLGQLELGLESQPVPLVVLNAFLQLLLVVQNVVLGEEEAC